MEAKRRAGGRPARRVIVLGERNSGTNYAEQLVAANLDVECVAGVIAARWSTAAQRLPWWWRERAIDAWFAVTRTVWKHGLLDDTAFGWLDSDDIAPVAVVKHPLAWAVSMHRRPYHRAEHHDDPVAFCSSPWRTIGRERMGRRTFANCFELWTEKQAAFLDRRDRGELDLWRYEDLLDDEVAHLTALARRLGVAPPPTTVVGVGASTKAQFDDGRDGSEIVEYYREERWRDDVAAATRDLAARTCGDVAGRLGYEI